MPSQLHDFYARTLPPTGNYALFRTGSAKHQWTDSIEELVELTETHATRTDVYYATASFTDQAVANGNKDSRTQARAVEKKCFYIDLDAGSEKLRKHGADKVYEDRDDAIKGLRDFLAKTNMGLSMLVASGEGLHVYWELDAAVPAAQWTPIAKRFQKFAVSHGLKVDAAVTADSARILRPVGTLHKNGNTVALIKDTHRTYSLAEFATLVGAEIVEPKPQYDLSVNDDIAPPQGPPKSLNKIIEHCAAVRFAVENQNKIEEPQWRLLIGIAKHTLGGREDAHRVSSDHLDYDPAQVDSYFDRWATGPSTCEKFAECNPTACAACKFNGKIKSPIVLGALNVEEVQELPEDQKPEPPPLPVPKGDPWDGCIPEGFDVVRIKGSRTLVGYVDIEKENALGERVPVRITVPITHEIFWLGHWADAADSDDFAQTTVFRLDEDGRVTPILMEQSIVASRAELAKFMAGKGIHTTTDKRAIAAMEDYMKAQLQRIKAMSRRPKIQQRFGLHYLPDGRMVMAHGKYVISADGTITESILSAPLRSMADRYPIPLPFNNEGSWEKTVWKESVLPKARQHVEFMRKYYAVPGMERYQLAFMLGLASPLMAFVDGGFFQGKDLSPNGLTVSLYSKMGGRGKSSVMRAAVLAYGSPEQLSRDSNNNATTNLARIQQLAISGSFPLGMDEMGDTDVNAINGIVSMVANGASRSGMKKDGTLRDNPPWALICMMAANRSARDMIGESSNATNAVQLRLLEIDVDRMPDFSIEQRATYAEDWAQLRTCTGALGALLGLSIVRAGGVNMSKLVVEKVNTASRLVQSAQGERFQYRALGAVLAVQEMLDAVGLKMFDTEALITVFRQCLTSTNDYIKQNTQSVDGLELLSKALHDLQVNTVITLNETRRSGPITAYDEPINTMPLHIRARHVVTFGATYVDSTALREWCAKNKARLSDLIGAAKHGGVLQRMYSSQGGTEGTGKQWTGSKNLLTGMRASTGARVNCYCINVRQLSTMVGGNIDEEVMQTLRTQAQTNVVPLPTKQSGS